MPAIAEPRFTGKGLEKLAAFEKLTELRVCNNKLKDADLAPLAKLKGLRKLTLFAPEATNAGVNKLKALTKLQYLDLCGTNMTADASLALRALPALKVLKVNLIINGPGMAKQLKLWESRLPKTRIVPLPPMVVPGG
jgi:hypothetical protein